MAELNFDVVMIGSGPGGYVGAIRCAQLGLKTAIVEKEKTFGGVCLNVGCIPSKALLESSEHYHMAQHDLASHGVQVSGTQLDLGTMMARKDKIVKDLTNGVAFLMKKNKIETFKGFGKILKAGVVEVKLEDGSTVTLNTKNIICATGSTPVELPFLKFDEKRILSSTGALSIPAVPKKLVVVGGGVIGLELGSVWNRLGSDVTVIEYADRLCPAMDAGLMEQLKRSLTKQGIKFLFKSKVTASKVVADGVELEYENMADSTKNQIKADVVLVSTGRKPFTEGLGLKEVGVELDPQGRIKVDQHYQSNVPGIYAIGDVIIGPMLAHKAEEEGVALAEILAGQHGHVNYDCVPSVIYTMPEVASVGMSEEQLKEKGIPYKAGQFPFTASGRAKAAGFTEGYVKILAHAESDKILGAHIIGAKGSEIISELVMAMEFGASSEDVARSFHAHPTLAEVIREAALNVEKRARQG